MVLINKDENVHWYEVKGGKSQIENKDERCIFRFAFKDFIWLVQRRQYLVRYEDERYGVSDSPKSLGI